MEEVAERLDLTDEHLEEEREGGEGCTFQSHAFRETQQLSDYDLQGKSQSTFRLDQASQNERLLIVMFQHQLRTFRCLSHRHLLGTSPRAQPNFSTICLLQIKQMPPRPSVNEAEITEAFLKGSGPGGQKIVRTQNLIASTRSRIRQDAC